jgi:hypothetical protein
LGPTIPNGYRADLPRDLGVHAELSAAWYRWRAFALRLDGVAQMLAGEAAEPSCVPGTVCKTFVPHPDQVYSATLSAEFRPFGRADGPYALAGAGAYHARGPDAMKFGTTAGGLVGVGVDFARPMRPGFAVEFRYHYIPNEFGRLTGMVAPSILFRF